MTKENRQRPYQKTVQSLPVLLSAVFLKAEVRLSRPPQVPGRRAGFPARWIPPYGKSWQAGLSAEEAAQKLPDTFTMPVIKISPTSGSVFPAPAPGRIAPFPIVMYP